MAFGPHLIIDLKDCSNLRDHDGLKRLLMELPDKLGLKRISEPYIKEYKDSFAQTAGYTGFVLLSESHFSFHTFPDQRYCFADIFSCSDFDTGIAVSLLKEFFCTENIDLNLQKRGKGFVR